MPMPLNPDSELARSMAILPHLDRVRSCGGRLQVGDRLVAL